jgi:predicted Fe-S protein YdhL (DUF1289 family)
MADAGSEARRARPMSPCISVCALDHSGHCAGCLRTRDEIAGWIRMTAEQQWDLLRELERRRVGKLPRRTFSGG